jgi:proline dehydrogenase
VLRSLLLYLSTARWARRIVTRWGFARRAARRFVAGETLPEAIQAAKALERYGLTASIDHLGEHVTNRAEAVEAAEAYLLILDRICEEGVGAYASLKLSQLGLAIGLDLCLDNLRRVLHKAADCGIFLRIDMEDSSTVDRTLEVYHRLRDEGLVNLGVVIQSYLHRSLDDVRHLTARGASIRLCKGAYREPPTVAFPRKADVDRNFDLLAETMIAAAVDSGSRPPSSDGRIPPRTAIATHDEKRIAFARGAADRLGLPRAALEFQMLYGIRSDLQRSLAAQGYPVRVYIPYGGEWYPYYVRRLAERPANVWFFLSQLLRP